MKKLTILAGISLCISIPATSVSESLSNVTIEKIQIRTQNNNSLIKLSKRFTNTCDDNGVYGLLRTDGTESSKLAWSVIMAAYAMNSTVTISTSNVCAYHNEITEVILTK